MCHDVHMSQLCVFIDQNKLLCVDMTDIFLDCVGSCILLAQSLVSGKNVYSVNVCVYEPNVALFVSFMISNSPQIHVLEVQTQQSIGAYKNNIYLKQKTSYSLYSV